MIRIKKNIVNVDYGKLIYSNRINQNITQEVLSSGICSISYLSKVENNKIIISEEILLLLIDKLGINLKEYEKNYEVLIEDIKNCYEAITDKEIHQIDNLIEKIHSFPYPIHSTDILMYKTLLEIRYYLFKKELDSAQKLLTNLKRHSKTLNNNMLGYYNYFWGIYHYLKGEYIVSLNYLNEGIREFSYTNDDNDPNIYYHLALVYSRTNNEWATLDFAEKSIELFTTNLKYKRVIECQIIIGIHYIKQYKFDKARSIFRKMIDICRSNHFINFLSKALHNYGYIESLTDNYENAIKYYLESLEFKDEKNETYINTLLYISYEYANIGDTTACLESVDRIIKLVKKYGFSKNYLIKAMSLYYEIHNEHEKHLIFLEQEAIPYYQSKQDIENSKNFLYKTALEYERKNMYKKSSDYYKKILKLSL